jgi:hypothetical protein
MWIAIGFVSFIVLIIPIAGLWTWHTQEMVKLKAKNAENVPSNELAQMKAEVTELRQMITSLAINVENMKDNYAHVSALEDRMKVSQ